MVGSDSLICRRIVSAFFDFLSSVEAAPGVDVEGLEVAKDCLSQFFQLDQLPHTLRPQPNHLINLFSEPTIGPCSQTDSSKTPKPQDDDEDDAGVRESDDSGVSKDELFGHFFDALEKIHFFRTTPNGDEDHVLLDRATYLFHDALNEIEQSGSKLFDRKSLADALKTLGNKVMQSKLYSDAIERYTCAIALCGNNAVYYCNRAAAYTQMCKYNEAITDCLKSIEVDPNYSKAYSRMGLAYYAQGKYSDAINKGFRKALELDPNNDYVKENLRAAEQKLINEQEQRNHFQSSGFNFAGGSGDQVASSPFASIPANLASMFSNMGRNPADQTREYEGTLPSGSASFAASDIAGMFMNMTGQGSQRQSGQGEPQGSRVDGSDDSGIGGGGASFNLEGQTPEEINQMMRSMMGMLSRGVQGDSQGNANGRSDSR